MKIRKYIILLAFVIFSLSIDRVNIAAASENVTPTQTVIKDTDTTMKDKGNKAYDEIRERAEQSFLDNMKKFSTESEDSDADPVRDVWVGIFYAYDIVKAIAPVLFLGSIMLGILISKLAKQNKGVRRFGIYFLCITLPILLLLFIYGLPYLYDLLAQA